MGTGRTGRAALALVAAVAVLAGCSGADDAGDEAVVETGVEDTATQEETEAAGGDTAAGEADDGGEAAPGDAGEPPAVAVGGDTAGRDVIREATLTLTTDDPDATVDAIGRAAEAAGGFVAGTDLHREGGVLSGTITVRVPAEQLSGTLGRIEDAGTEVQSRQLSSQDVTGEVSDVSAQLRNLRAVETELLGLLAEAREQGGTDDVLTVFDRMRGVREEIERLEGRRATLDDLVALATVTVDVVPTPDLLAATAQQRDPEPGPWDPGRQVRRAWDATVGALRATVDVLVVLVVTVLPVLLVWGLPVVVAVWLVRRWRRRGTPPPPTSPPAAPSRSPAGSVPSRSDADGD